MDSIYQDFHLTNCRLFLSHGFLETRVLHYLLYELAMKVLKECLVNDFRNLLSDFLQWAA